VLNNFTTWFCFFSEKNEKHLIFFFKGTLLIGLYVFFGFGHRLGLALQNGFDSFLKSTNTSTKWFVVFWENANSLIPK